MAKYSVVKYSVCLEGCHSSRIIRWKKKNMLKDNGWKHKQSYFFFKKNCYCYLSLCTRNQEIE